MKRIFKYYKKTFILIFSCLLGFSLFISCSSDNSAFTELSEKVNEDPEYVLFNVLDRYPALANSFDNVDPFVFNDKLKEIVQAYPDETKEFFSILMPLVVTDSGDKGAVLNLMSRITGIMDVIINQNSYDNDGYDYASDFYSFFDSFSQSNADITTKLLPIVNNSVKYIQSTYSSSTIDSVMTDLMAFLKDDTGAQPVKSVLEDLFTAVGKLTVRANTYEPLADKVGNGVNGVDQLLFSLNSFAGLTEGRTRFYNVLRELGNYTAVEVETNDPAYPEGKKYLKHIIREFVIKYSSLFIGGSTYNPGNQYYNAGSPYINAQFKNSVKELFPPLVQLFLRSDNNGAIIKHEGNSAYLLELLGKDLSRLNFDLDSMDVDSSLYDMIRYDGYGKDRMTNPSANGLTFLENMIYTLLAANYTGYLTRTSDSGEPDSNHGRGHGVMTGGTLTLNDCLYSMGNGSHSDPLGENHTAYSLCLNDRVDQAGKVFRSSSSFNYTQRNSHKFFEGYDFPALCLLSGNGAGDAGIPNGGESGITPDSNATTVGGNNDYRTYYPKVANGIGELSTGRWVMGWIARSCWEGEGPYYATEGGVDNGNGTYTYYSPDGEIYATVDKSDPANWTFTYEAGVEHYSAQWQTDYFLINADKHNGSSLASDRQYFAPNRVWGTSGNDRFRMGTTSSGQYAYSTNAGALTYNEMIDEDNQGRECATHEEAMFRNYQWLMGEKKFVFVMPMQVSVSKCSIDIRTAVYALIECNGIQGITNAKKGSGNNVWIKKGNEGLDISRSHNVTDRTGSGSINYGDSNIFGDARITVIIKEDHDDLFGIGDDVTLSVIWNEILGGGRMLANVIGVNLDPIIRLAFVKNENAVSSSDAGTSHANWSNRNQLFPTLAGLMGILHKRTDYVAASSGNNYNHGGSHRYPLKVLTDGILPPLAKPLFRRYSDFSGRWVPRILAGGQTESSVKFLQRNQSDDFYKPQGDLATTIGMLSESSKKRCDGIIASIARTDLVTRILQLLQIYGNSQFDDPGNYDASDYATWGARRKFFYGLEQIVTSIRTTQGEANQLGYIDLTYPAWIFTQNDQHLSLDLILDKLIGTYEATGMGLAGMIYRHEAADDWTNYIRVMNALPELLSANGSHNVMENVVSLLEEIFSKFSATEAELRGVRHTLGTLLYRYNSTSGTWEVGDDLINLITADLPLLHETYIANDGSTSSLLTFVREITRDDGIVAYLLPKLQSSYSSEEVFTQLYQFLSSPLMTEPNPLWIDLAALLKQSAKFIGPVSIESSLNAYVYPELLVFGSTVGESEEDMFEGLAGYDSTTNEFDPYLVLGELLSDRNFSILNIK